MSEEFIERVKHLGGSSEYVESLRGSRRPTRRRLLRLVHVGVNVAVGASLLGALYSLFAQILRSFDIQAAIDVLTAVTGVLAVVMLLVGCFRYVTSGGDANSVASAKNTIIYAIIGLFVLAVAQVLVQLVIPLVGH